MGSRFQFSALDGACSLASTRRFPALLACAAGVVLLLSSLHGAAPSGSDERVRELIMVLHLSVLPKESGYLGLIGESAQMIEVNGRSLAVQSQV